MHASIFSAFIFAAGAYGGAIWQRIFWPDISSDSVLSAGNPASVKFCFNDYVRTDADNWVLTLEQNSWFGDKYYLEANFNQLDDQCFQANFTVPENAKMATDYRFRLLRAYPYLYYFPYLFYRHYESSDTFKVSGKSTFLSSVAQFSMLDHHVGTYRSIYGNDNNQNFPDALTFKIQDTVDSRDASEIQAVINEVKEEMTKRDQDQSRAIEFKNMASDVFSILLWKAAEKANMVAYRVIMSDPFTGSLVRQSAVDLALVKAVEARGKKVVEDLSDLAELIQLSTLMTRQADAQFLIRTLPCAPR